MLRWLFVLSLVATLLVGLLPIPMRMAIDPSAPNEDSDYVFVHGVPKFFFVSSSSVEQRPAAPVLIGHFLFDWALAFAVFASIVILLECIRIAAFYAARGVHALQSDDNSRDN